ncbi:hypothetical protein ANN_17659 [Periplaneta americana]|uniref:Uncharacterized protein n=1 Tax=Periplaneta americana TaxID=6978 RepID=A0ABQ8STJ9_PERAM|nr:hypothetical protein ANN_17659 [Periplaneta americana]
MSSKVKRTIHSEGCEIIRKVIEYCDAEKYSGTFKYSIENATKHAAALTGKSESTIYKIRKESKLVDIAGHKLQSSGKKRKYSSKKIDLDDFDLCRIRETVHNYCDKQDGSNFNDNAGENKKTVIFLDEMWMHSTYTMSKSWQDTL